MDYNFKKCRIEFESLIKFYYETNIRRIRCSDTIRRGRDPIDFSGRQNLAAVSYAHLKILYFTQIRCVKVRLLHFRVKLNFANPVLKPKAITLP